MELIKLLVAVIIATQVTLIVIWLRGRKLRTTTPSASSDATTRGKTEDAAWLARFETDRLQQAPEAGDWINEAVSPKSEIIDELHRLTEPAAFSRPALVRIMDCGIDSGRLIDLIAQDSDLKAEIVATANSPLYDLAKPVNHALEAIALLGPLEIRNILIRGRVSQQVDLIKSSADDSAQKHWQHGFNVSRVTHALAVANQLPDPETLSTAALLHDVGKLFTQQRWPEAEKDHLERMPFSRYEYLIRERQWLGVDHGWLSGEMVRLWGLPAESISVITGHHLPSYLKPTDSGDSERTLATLHLADLLVHLSQIELEVAGYRSAPGWVALITGEDRFESLLSQPVLTALAAAENWHGMIYGSDPATGCQHQPARWTA